MSLWPSDWGAFLLPDAPIVELILRAAVIYLFLFTVMRLQGRRIFGGFALSDLLVMLLLAVAVREGITGGFRTVGDALISGGTILAFDRTIDLLAFRFPGLRRFLRQQPALLIREGELLIENARNQLVTRTEIQEMLREKGVSSMDEVREARLEPNGSLSVLKR